MINLDALKITTTLVIITSYTQAIKIGIVCN